MACHITGFFQGVGQPRGANAHANSLHGFLKELAVFGHFDRRQLGPNQLHTIASQHAALGQGHGNVQGRLAAHGGQQGIGPLFNDDFLNHFRGERLNVGAIGHFWVGHDRGWVGVHQHDLVPFGPERFTSLSTGVVKFAGLTNHDRAGTKEQNLANVVAAGHKGNPRGLAISIDHGPPGPRSCLLYEVRSSRQCLGRTVLRPGFALGSYPRPAIGGQRGEKVF